MHADVFEPQRAKNVGMDVVIEAHLGGTLKNDTCPVDVDLTC